MFEFLGAYEHIHLIKDFMHAWHGIEMPHGHPEEERKKKLIKEFDDFRKRTAQLNKEDEDYRVIMARRQQESDQRKVKRDPEAAEPYVESPTIADVSEGTGLSRDQIRQAMKSAEDDFVHMPHAEYPDMTRFALREHVERLGYEDWKPGTGF